LLDGIIVERARAGPLAVDQSVERGLDDPRGYHLEIDQTHDRSEPILGSPDARSFRYAVHPDVCDPRIPGVDRGMQIDLRSRRGLEREVRGVAQDQVARAPLQDHLPIAGLIESQEMRADLLGSTRVVKSFGGFK
jgi:hypothetical protein